VTGASGGSLLALSTGACWALSPICFASAGRRIGSYPVALLRLALASAILLALSPCQSIGAHTCLLPTPVQTLWIALSGLVGITIGDLLVYESLVRIGPQRTTQMMMLAPLASALLAWALTGEVLSPRIGLGSALVLAGTTYAVFEQKSPPAARPTLGSLKSGLPLAILGALCVGMGAVFQRLAFLAGPSLAAGTATMVRVVSASLFLWTAAAVRGDIPRVLSGLQDRYARNRLVLGAVFGTVIGMFCYVAALKNAPAGLVSTLAATSPLFVLIMLAVRRRTGVPLNLILASGTSLVGVGLICVR